MKNLNSGFTRFLVIWYAIFQIIHLGALINALVFLIKSGTITFPALPPSTGWTLQATYFLFGMGIIDFINIILSLIFVYGYFAFTRWRLGFGVLNLTAMMYSAVVFAFATIASGAWTNNLVVYILMTLMFIPVIVLYFQFTAQALKGRFYESQDGGTSFY